MLMKIGKWVSCAVLRLTRGRLTNVTCQVFLDSVVFVSSLVLRQTVRAGRHLLRARYLAIGVLFEPALPVVFARKTLLWLDWVSLMTFQVSLATLKRLSILLIPSLTNRTPGIESL